MKPPSVLRLMPTAAAHTRSTRWRQHNMNLPEVRGREHRASDSCFTWLCWSDLFKVCFYTFIFINFFPPKLELILCTSWFIIMSRKFICDLYHLVLFRFYSFSKCVAIRKNRNLIKTKIINLFHASDTDCFLFIYTVFILWFDVFKLSFKHEDCD